MVTLKELDRLLKTNEADKKALGMLDNLMCAYNTYNDFQKEALKVSEKLDIPDGALGFLCHLSARSRKDAQDMYRIWYESVDVVPMSDAVFRAIADAYDDILSDNS